MKRSKRKINKVINAINHLSETIIKEPDVFVNEMLKNYGPLNVYEIIKEVQNGEN